MIKEVMELLFTEPNGIYVDGTFGLGGHSLALAKKLSTRGRIFGLEKDPAIIAQAKAQGLPPQVTLIPGDFRDLTELLAAAQVEAIDGLLLDLGLNSAALDDPERGFSFDREGPLDMRFDPTQGPTAAQLLNHLPYPELARLFREYGEERRANRIAKEIVEFRKKQPLRTTAELAEIIRRVTPFTGRAKTLARIFQALRIAVNEELEALRAVLEQAVELLRSGGRLVVLSYHSLEDREVKHFFRREAQADPDGERLPRLKILTKKPLRPTPEESQTNPRARSARLRGAEKL